MSHLIFVYEKEAVFETKSGKVVAKFNGVTSSYNADAPTAKSDMSQKEKSELQKGIGWIHCAEYYWRDKDKVDRKVSV